MNKAITTKQYSNPQFEVVSNDNRGFFCASGTVDAIVNGSKINSGSATIDPRIEI